jgi:blocked early in transport 1
VTIAIGQEVRNHNDFLKEMDNDMDKTGGRMDATVRRLKNLIGTGGPKHICSLICFAFFVFVVIYFLL